MNQKLINHFFKNVIINENKCWDWKLCKVKGYGHGTVDGKYYRAHRVSYEIHFGIIPNDLLVLHKCDNPSCSNPSHLFLGTQQDNMNDKIQKKRNVGPRGEKCFHAKLTFDQVKNIKTLLNNPLKRGDQKKIAGQYNISRQTICDIKHNRIWKEY